MPKELKSQLKPCPFCGAAVDFEFGTDPHDDFRSGRGFCIGCEPCHVHLWSFAEETPEAVIERWNRRSEKDRVQR